MSWREAANMILCQETFAKLNELNGNDWLGMQTENHIRLKQGNIYLSFFLWPSDWHVKGSSNVIVLFLWADLGQITGHTNTVIVEKKLQLLIWQTQNSHNFQLRTWSLQFM